MKPLGLITISSSPSVLKLSKKYTHFSYANLLIFTVYSIFTLDSSMVYYSNTRESQLGTVYSTAFREYSIIFDSLIEAFP